MGPIDFLVTKAMIPFLNFSYHSIYPNYGLAIILLTLLVKVLFYPLTQKQFHSMEEMRKVQPKLKELQAKHKGEPEKLQKAMMQLYKDHQVNPFSGCLPILLQLPFFFAIFYTIKSAAFTAILAQPGINPGLFSFWLARLSDQDSLHILPLVIGISTYLTQKMMMPATSEDPMQKMMLAMMPALMVIICWKMPAGVLIYWAASQVISAIQQAIILRKLSEKGAVKVI